MAGHQSGVCSRAVSMSVLLALLLLLLSATWTASARDCRQEDLHFEMMTGYVYSAPGEIMVTSPGVLLLRDCLEQCRHNDSCRAINFETGLCVLFSGSYTDQPGRFYMGTVFRIWEGVQVCLTVSHPQDFLPTSCFLSCRN